MIIGAGEVFPSHEVNRSKVVTITVNAFGRGSPELTRGSRLDADHVHADFKGLKAQLRWDRHRGVALHDQRLEEVVLKFGLFKRREFAMDVSVELIKFFILEEPIVIEDFESSSDGIDQEAGVSSSSFAFTIKEVRVDGHGIVATSEVVELTRLLGGEAKVNSVRSGRSLGRGGFREFSVFWLH